MKASEHNDFDRRMRSRAAQEPIRLKPEAEVRFEQAMARARTQPAEEARGKRHWGWKLGAALAVQCALVLAILWFVPAQDRVKAALPMDAPKLVSSEMLPLAQSEPAPQAQVDAVYTQEGFQVVGSFRNQADDIWLMGWSAQTGDRRTGDLLWLEPGAACVQHTVWQNLPAKVELHWQYQGYRVTADVLHWVDSEAEEADQKTLMEDAFACGALLLLPGDWENGAAGPMQLLLPESYQQANPNVTPLDYYLAQGLIEAQEGLCSAEGSAMCVRAD